jgi:hypothetical protein
MLPISISARAMSGAKVRKVPTSRTLISAPLVQRLSFESSVVVLHLERGLHRDWRKSAMIYKTANDFWVRHFGEGECDPLGRDALASEFRSAFAAMAKTGAQAVVVQVFFDPHRAIHMSGSREVTAAGGLVSIAGNLP